MSSGKLPGPYIEYVKLEGSSGSTAYIGSTVNLTCKAQDYNVQNSFVKDNARIKEGDQKHYEYFHMNDRDKNVKILNLEIKNVTLEDAGNYTCYAVLGNGLRTFATFHLKVGMEILLQVNVYLNVNNQPFILHVVPVTQRGRPTGW